MSETTGEPVGGGEATYKNERERYLAAKEAGDLNSIRLQIIEMICFMGRQDTMAAASAIHRLFKIHDYGQLSAVLLLSALNGPKAASILFNVFDIITMMDLSKCCEYVDGLLKNVDEAMGNK